MLEFENIELTVDTAKLKQKTEAYMVEVLAQRISDLFLARHGEHMLAEISRDELVLNAKKRILETLNEEGQTILRRD